MPSAARNLIALVAILSVAFTCRADISPQVIARGKAATALVTLPNGRPLGTAFCINAEGYFATTAHVVSASGGNASLVLHVGEKSQKTFKAALVRQDASADLAILKVEGADRFRALDLGSAAGLIETQPVVDFGFPFGSVPATAKEYPPLSVHLDHIAALRKHDGILSEILVDAPSDPGCSGGPIVNERGDVIGIAAAVPGGVASAIPIARLQPLMDQATITVSPQAIAPGRIHRPQEFVVTVNTLRKSAIPIDVTLVLTSGGGSTRAFAPTSTDGHNFHVSAIPVLAEKEPRRLGLTITDGSGDLVLRCRDRTVTVGATEVPLSTVQRISPGPRGEVQLRNGRTLRGPIKGIEIVPATFGGIESPVNLSHVERIVVTEIATSPVSITYEAVARQAGREIARISGRLDVDANGETAPLTPRFGRGLTLLVCNYGTNSVQWYDAYTGAFIKDFAQGNGISRPNCAIFGPDGNLYVTSGGSSEVERFDGRTGQFIDHFATGNGLNDVVGIAFGPDGNLYVSSFAADNVKRFNGKTGAYIDDFITRESGGIHMPYLFTFGPDNNLYIASHGTGQIKCYNGRTGAFIRDFCGGNGLDRPCDLMFGPDGSLYVTSRDSGEVKRFNGKTGEFMNNFIPRGAGGMGKPWCLAFGPDGNLYVGCWDGKQIKRFSGQTGAYIDDFIPEGKSTLSFPTALLFAPLRRQAVSVRGHAETPRAVKAPAQPAAKGQGLTLFVCSNAASVVKLYNGETGEFIKDFAQGNCISEPFGFAFGPDGNLYVSGGSAILRFDGSTGQFIDQFATGNGLSATVGIAFGPDGLLYVCNRGTDEIKRFNGRTGAFIDTFVAHQSGGLQIPWSLAFGPDNNLYVSSHWTNQVKCYDGKTGAFLRDFCGANGLARPEALVFGPDRNLYVTSAASDEIKRYNGRSGEFMGNFVSKNSGGLERPGILTFGPDGYLYVGSWTCIKRYNGRTGAYINDIVSPTGGELNPTGLVFRPLRR